LGDFGGGLGVFRSCLTPATFVRSFLGDFAPFGVFLISPPNPLDLLLDFLSDFPDIGETNISTGREGVWTESKSKSVASRLLGVDGIESDWERKSFLGVP